MEADGCDNYHVYSDHDFQFLRNEHGASARPGHVVSDGVVCFDYADYGVYHAEKQKTEVKVDDRAMSRLDELIKELCPDGVEYVKIRDYFTRLKGTPITAQKMKEIAKDDGKIKIFAGGKTVINANEEDIPKANITRIPAVLVQSRGIIDVIYCEKPFTFKNEMWAYTHENQITVKYLYYIMKKDVLYFRDCASGMGSLPQISLKVTEGLKIPLPPLEIQREIVRILDSFTEYTALLEKELALRKKQYAYYRNMLLDFGDNVERRTLGEIFNIRDGTHDTPKKSDKGFPLVTSKNIINGIIDKSSCYLISKNDYDAINQRSKVYINNILMSMIGTIGATAIVKEEPNYAIKNIGLIMTTNEIQAKFINFYLNSNYAQKYISENIKGTAPKYLSLTALRNFPVPFLPLEEQKRIVEILDRFDKLCNDLTSGLPAEINARKKQYAY